MPKLCDAASCTGCGTCAQICPKGAIAMTVDTEGFLRPKISAEKCVNCSLCEKSCPILDKIVHKIPSSTAFAAHSLDAQAVAQSSSGGIFSLLAQQVLDAGGMVFGAALDESWNVRHIAVESKEALFVLRGSKYVQSSIGQTYQQAKQALTAGRSVLFSGTPCQIGGLRAFLGKDYENLLCVDTICHSVPSEKAWQAFLLEQSGGEKIVHVSFRDKRDGWQGYYMCIRTESGREVLLRPYENPYMQGFLQGLTTRPSCYQCHFKGNHRFSDITLGDFWGVDKTYPQHLWKAGTSLVLCNSEKGMQALNAIGESAVLEPVDFERALEHNPAYFHSSNAHTKRARFWHQLDNQGFSKSIENCRKAGPMKQFCSLTGAVLRKLGLRH